MIRRFFSIYNTFFSAEEAFFSSFGRFVHNHIVIVFLFILEKNFDIFHDLFVFYLFIYLFL